jgi:hypothetical protein
VSRTRPQTDLEQYLLNAFLLRQDWVPDRPTIIRGQMHETERTSSGHFIFVEGGKPAIKSAYMNRLSGFPYQVVRIAIEAVRAVDPQAIRILEWYQRPASFRLGRYAMAVDEEMSESNLTRRMHSAVRQIHAHLGWALEEWDKPTHREV